MNSLRSVIVTLLIILLAAARFHLSAETNSDAWPNRPIQVVVPYTAGGGTDSFVRLLSNAIAEEDLLPQPLVVMNQPGGSGTIGSRFVKDARPDGYRILCHHESIITAQLSGTVAFGPDDFVPIAHTGDMVLLVVVREDAAYQSIRDLLQEAKEKPRTVRFGANPGSPAHFTAMKLQAAYPGAELNLITAGGGQKRYISLLGGHLEAGIFSLAEYLSFRSEEGMSPDKNIRALAVLSEKPQPALPGVPTCLQEGIEATSSNAYYWFAPKGTPPEIVDAFSDAFRRAMRNDGVRKTLTEWSISTDFTEGEELRQRLNTRMTGLKPLAFINQTALPNFPLLAGIAAGILTLLVVAIEIKDRKSSPRRVDEVSLNAPTAASSARLETRKPLNRLRPGSGHRRATACFFLLMMYVAVLQSGSIPFVISTALLVFAVGTTICAWNRSRAVPLLQIALAVGLATELVFTHVFAVPLP